MGPYRKPQPLSPPPRDPMRVVLIVTGAIALAVLCFAGVSEWTGRRAAPTPPAASARPPDRVPSAVPSEAPSLTITVAPGMYSGPLPTFRPPLAQPVGIRQGLAVSVMQVSDVLDPAGTLPSSSFDESLAVFRNGDAAAPAVALFRTTNGSSEVALAGGRYDVCTGGDAEPTCRYQGTRIKCEDCPPNDKACKRTPPDGSRKAWSGPCHSVDVADGVVRMSIARAAYSETASCTPASACVR